MDILIKNATVVTGDGKTVLDDASIVIENGRIAGVEQGNGNIPADPDAAEIIDASGKYVFPGLINSHAHCCSLGPKFSSAAPPPSLDEVRKNIDRHMRQGSTTLINLSGFGTIEETDVVNELQPVRVLTGTCHFPSCFKAAQMLDGAGLCAGHLELSPEKMLEKGAVVIGEIGSGATLGGGVVDYKYIPETIAGLTGKTLGAEQANRLKKAFLPDYDHGSGSAGDEPSKLLAELGLEKDLSVERMRQILLDIVSKPLETALSGFDEACVLGAKTGVPVICHNALPSFRRIMKLAEDYAGTSLKLIAGHCNHPSFSLEETVVFATLLKKRGVIIDVSSLDSIVTRWMNSPERIELLVRENLADTFSTDYGGGRWDSVLQMIEYLVGRKLIDLPAAVAKASSVPAGLYGPKTKDLGLVARSKIADLILVDKSKISNVSHVIIQGKSIVI